MLYVRASDIGEACRTRDEGWVWDRERELVRQRERWLSEEHQARLRAFLDDEGERGWLDSDLRTPHAPSGAT